MPKLFLRGKRAALNDPRGNLIYEYLRLVREVRPDHFVLENVANLATAALRHRPIAERPGKHWSLKRYDQGGTGNSEVQALEPDERASSALRQILCDVNDLGYGVTFGVLNAADYGASQNRMRLFMIGSRDGKTPFLPEATHGNKPGLRSYRTVRDAISHLAHEPGPHSSYTEAVRRFFELVPTGGNWRDLPVELQREAMGGSFESGGGKTGFYRRLNWDLPAPTITGRANRKGSALCHPDQVRPLSVSECAALQGFPPEWQFSGSMNAQYKQVGNAVPISLASAVAHAVLKVRAENQPLQYGSDSEELLDSALRTLRATARNKKSRSRQPALMLD